MTKYHVEFDVVSRHAWTDSSMENNKYLLLGDNEVLRIPKYANITEIQAPLLDGYYIMVGVSYLYRRLEGKWSKRDSSGWDHTGNRTDNYMRNNGVEFLAPIFEE